MFKNTQLSHKDYFVLGVREYPLVSTKLGVSGDVAQLIFQLVKLVDGIASP